MKGRTASDSLIQSLALIRHRLVQQGWIAPAVLLARVQTWPWQSPAPPGWLAGPGRPQRSADEQEEGSS
jgi:hypothetical protein